MCRIDCSFPNKYYPDTRGRHGCKSKTFSDSEGFHRYALKEFLVIWPGRGRHRFEITVMAAFSCSSVLFRFLFLYCFYFLFVVYGFCVFLFFPGVGGLFFLIKKIPGFILAFQHIWYRLFTRKTFLSSCLLILSFDTQSPPRLFSS